MKLLTKWALLLTLLWGVASYAMAPNQTFDVTLHSLGQRYSLSDMIESTTESELTFQVVVTWTEAQELVPVLVQFGTVQGLTGGYSFAVSALYPDKLPMCTEYKGVAGRSANTKVWLWMMPGQTYTVKVKFPPSVQLWKKILGVNAWKYWMPRFNGYIKPGKFGDGHTAEFGKP